MTPDICFWPNQYVYNGELINSRRVREPAFQFLFGDSSIPSYAFINLDTVSVLTIVNSRVPVQKSIIAIVMWQKQKRLSIY